MTSEITVDSFIKWVSISCIAGTYILRGYLILWFFQSVYKAYLKYVIFVEHLNSWFTCTHETHKNRYPTNIDESTVL